MTCTHNPPNPACHWCAMRGALNPQPQPMSDLEVMTEAAKDFMSLVADNNRLTERVAELETQAREAAELAPHYKALEAENAKLREFYEALEAVWDAGVLKATDGELERLREARDALKASSNTATPTVSYETPSVSEGCEAVQHSDQMVCDKCTSAWDVNDTDPPPCSPNAEG